MDFENTFTVAATYISKIPELSSLVPERVLNIMSSAVGGYPLIQYLLSLHS